MYYHICVFVSGESRVSAQDSVIKKVRKFKKFYFNYIKALLDLAFPQFCKKEKLIWRFLQFNVAKKQLEPSEAYLSCQVCLLNQEISIEALIKEYLLVNREQPQLGKTTKSFPLKLLD